MTDRDYISHINERTNEYRSKDIGKWTVFERGSWAKRKVYRTVYKYRTNSGGIAK